MKNTARDVFAQLVKKEQLARETAVKLLSSANYYVLVGIHCRTKIVIIQQYRDHVQGRWTVQMMTYDVETDIFTPGQWLLSKHIEFAELSSDGRYLSYVLSYKPSPRQTVGNPNQYMCVISEPPHFTGLVTLSNETVPYMPYVAENCTVRWVPGTHMLAPLVAGYTILKGQEMIQDDSNGNDQESKTFEILQPTPFAKILREDCQKRFEHMRVPELKQALKDRGARFCGRRSELMERLVEANLRSVHARRESEVCRREFAYNSNRVEQSCHAARCSEASPEWTVPDSNITIKIRNGYLYVADRRVHDLTTDQFEPIACSLLEKKEENLSE